MNICVWSFASRIDIETIFKNSCCLFLNYKYNNWSFHLQNLFQFKSFIKLIFKNMINTEW